MPKETAPQQTKSAETKWGSFEKAGLEPTEIMCQAYLPVHRHDGSCHTRLLTADASAIERHLQADHSGGYRFTLKKTGRSWPGWLDLKNRGLECFDFRCDVCDANVPMQTQYLMVHMKPHVGKNRRITKSGVFWATIGYERPLPAVLDAEDDEAA